MQLSIQGCEAVVHTATLHKPHVGTHTRQNFVDTNISGTLNLLEESLANGSQSFVYTSTTSTFGDAMRPAPEEYVKLYARKQWKMFPTLSRVYDNSHARKQLGWEPLYTFSNSIEKLIQGCDYRSELTKIVGSKGYHDQIFNAGPYQVSSC